MDPFLAIDWGTTNRRIYLIEGGQVLHTERDGRGVASGPDFPAEVEAIRTRFGHHKILLAGMIGSTIGWKQAPYVPCPAGLEALADGALDLGDGVYILPGVSRLDDARADVMRGEEVQLIGAVAAGLAPPDALLIQPGTHCKWAAMSDGAIARFTTAMTGELFALLRDNSILAPNLHDPVEPGKAFLTGVAKGLERDLSAELFGIRSAAVLGRSDESGRSSFASGLLIGAEVAGRLAEYPAETAYILADNLLGGLYAQAIEHAGCKAVTIDSHAAFVDGIVRLEKLLP
ncbi:2-dehydro-3-deoxygalactonokinase [Citromicrobium bathyomarinum]|uniref:2-dehydro-3-deoxygalactonokinase n=1 Tax=Citromicrobium bathyomarinum TaxID=72174 RepID=UPI003159F59E